MVFCNAPDLFESIGDLILQLNILIPFNLKATAFSRPDLREDTYNHILIYYLFQCSGIMFYLFRRCHEMKCSTIMPDIVFLFRLKLSYVSHDPMYLAGFFTKTFFSPSDGIF